ncbi:MAG: hypothetical protein K1X71_00290 [Pirellulales bacterium]|nr:hypothetical protein [Pirellulales bacterium]
MAGGLYFYNHVDDELRRRIEERFAQHYPELQIKVHAATLIPGEGIEVRGMTITQPGAAGPRVEVARFDEMLLACKASLSELIQHEPEFTEIRVRRPTLLATRRPDGTWSTGELLPFPQISEKPPRIVVEGGTVEIFDPLRNPTSKLSLRDVYLEVDPGVGGDNPESTTRRLHGFMVGDHVQRLEFEGELGDGGKQWSFRGTGEGLDLSPELYAALPGEVAAKLDVLRSLRASSQFRFSVQNSPDDASAIEYDLQGKIARGRIEDSRLPYPLTDVFALVRCTNQGVHISELRARNGQTAIYVREAWRRGNEANSPLFANLQCERLVIDRRLLDILPEQWRARWYDFFLEGIVNVNAIVHYDGQSWQPDVSVECLDTSFTYHKFPYRLENGQGHVRLKDDRLDFLLSTYSGADQVLIQGNVQNLYQDPGLWLEVRADRLAIDKKLLESLPPTSRAVLTSFSPSGHFRVDFEARRQPGPQQPVSRRLRLQLDHCSMRYDRFPYPIHNVTGTVEMLGDEWEFRNLEGTNDTGELRGYGRLGPTASGRELRLNISGANIALEQELRNALPLHSQRLWDNLQPRGSVQLATDIRYQIDTKQLAIGVSALPVAETVSIQPVFFPYRIENIRGELSYANGRVVLGRAPRGEIKGQHQGVDVALRGVCDLAPDGRWRLALDDLTVYRLRADRDLQAAVSPRLNPWLRRLDPASAINLSGRVELLGGGAGNQPPQAQWNMRITTQGANLVAGLPLTNISGEAHLQGGFDGAKMSARAELDLDSVTWKNMQITSVTGPARVDGEHILLGAWADKDLPQGRPRPITGKAYGGWLMSDGWVKLEATPRYGWQITAGDLDVARIGRELLPGTQSLSGKLNGGVNLRGSTEGIHTLTGTGYMRLRDADLYQLPQMVQLLNIVSLKPPDATAFTNSEADFRVDGDHLYFDRINFTGDAISLKGQGEMNLNTDVALTFYALVGRDELEIPLIPELFRAASRQLMLIHVDGKLTEPSIRRDPFPVVGKALEQLQADLQNGAPPKNPQRLGLLSPRNGSARRGGWGDRANPQSIAREPARPAQSERKGGLLR